MKRIEETSGLKNFELHSVDDEYKKSPVKSQYVTYIMLYSEDLKIEFRIYYFTNEIQQLVSNTFRRKPEEITHALVHDSMKEFTNLVGATVKAHLQNSIQNIGLSLPLSTRGFDEVWESEKKSNEHYWAIKWSGGKIVLKAVLVFENINFFDSIFFENKEDDGEMEMM